MPRKSAKSREASELVQTNLRWRATEHAWLVAQAKQHRVSLNSEIVWRVMRSRDQDADMQLREVAEEVVQRLEPYLVNAHERGLYGDLLAAARQLVDAIAPHLAVGLLKGRAGQQVREAIDAVHLARGVLEVTAGGRLISVRGRPEEGRAQFIHDSYNPSPTDEEPGAKESGK
jgi:hypothetical protein